MSTKGYIYIFKNPSFKGWVKIGYADDWKERLDDLNRSSAVPLAFNAYATYEVNEKLTDKALHSVLDLLRPDMRSRDRVKGRERVREFFAIPAEDAYKILEAIAKISGTSDRLHRIEMDEEAKAEEKYSDEIKEEFRRGPFNFKECGIKPGSKIRYTKDKSIEAIVVDERRVQYKDETMSVSALAKLLMNITHSIQGTKYFEYEGENLDELRTRLGK